MPGGRHRGWKSARQVLCSRSLVFCPCEHSRCPARSTHDAGVISHSVDKSIEEFRRIGSDRDIRVGLTLPVPDPVRDRRSDQQWTLGFDIYRCRFQRRQARIERDGSSEGIMHVSKKSLVVFTMEFHVEPDCVGHMPDHAVGRGTADVGTVVRRDDLFRGAPGSFGEPTHMFGGTSRWIR